jgi:N utilization substance protein B
MSPAPSVPASPSGGTVGGRKANRRGAARLAAVQALYQMDLADTDLLSILAQFESDRLGEVVDGERLLAPDIAFFRDIVTGVVNHQLRIDPVIHETLVKDWPLRRLDLTLRAILRAGGFELLERRDVPPRVTISEYVDIARAFYGDGDEPGMVNAVLDRVARKVRADDLAPDAGR